ncbi:MAG: choice-of-anchor D domain-containing protein [Planctomycetes bacterium]|nr:choice-of-anchor D domain-containing protein [Planctomycetota bacterium]
MESAVRGGRNIDQKNGVPDDTFYPDGFGFPPGFGSLARWETIDVVNISGNTLTVLLQAESTTEYVLADSVLIDRLGDVPSGPEIVVVENNHNAAGGTLSYGTTQLNHPVEKTFTITNSGMSELNITSPITITGANAAAFQVVSGPSSTAIAPGGTSTFVIRLTAAYEGTKNATISFTTNDADESTVNLNIAGEVLNYRIIDDQNATDGYSQSGMTGSLSGISYQGDVSSANSSTLQGPASATWTFSNMSPGTYYVALTWFDTSSNPSPYSSNTPVTVMDGAVVKFDGTINQRVAPATFTFDGVSWFRLGFFDFSGGTVTVTMANANTDGVILADGAILARTGGGIPAGNGEPLAAIAPTPGENNATPVNQTSAREAALSSTLYWNDLDDEAAALPEGIAGVSEDLFADVYRRRATHSDETNLRSKARRSLATAALTEDED